MAAARLQVKEFAVGIVSGRLGRVRMVVWVDGWQMQCCGDPFAVGQEVAWTLADQPDRDGFTDTVGAEVAGRLTHAEEHHGGLPEDHPVTRGTVLAITKASCRYAPRPEDGAGGMRYPVPGSAALQKITKTAQWEQEDDGLRFNGYVVELRVAEG